MNTRHVPRLTTALAGLPVLFAFTIGATQAALPVMSRADTDTGMPMSAMPMHSQMTHMRDVMGSIEGTTDPAERERLMEEHMEAMQGMMQMMHGMMASQGAMHRHGGAGNGPGAMSRGMDPESDVGNAMGTHGGAAGDADTRLDMIVQRLDAMQLLMDQVLRAHRQMMGNKP